MNIALVTETFPPEVNGVAMTYGVITRELARRGHALTIYRPRLPRRDGLLAAEGTEVSVPGLPIPGYPQLRFGLPAGRRLRSDWAHQKPDLVHVATEGPLGNSAVAAARSLGIPVTSGFHTNFHAYTRHYGLPWLRRPMLGWLRRFHNRTRLTFAPTQDLCTELEAQGFRGLAVLSRGVDLEDFNPERRSPELRRTWNAGPENPVVLHVGRMAPEKNYALLFRVYAAMRAANPALRFVLAGEGPLRAGLEREHPGCTFVGFFSRRDIGRYYASADIYVHASLSETFGNVLLEALASGLAVAGFDYAAARRFVGDGVNGLSVPTSDPDALIAAGIRLAQDAELRQRLRERARSAVARQAWTDVVARFEADLARIAGVPLHRGESALS